MSHKLLDSFSRIDDNWGKHSMTVFFASIFGDTILLGLPSWT